MLQLHTIDLEHFELGRGCVLGSQARLNFHMGIKGFPLLTLRKETRHPFIIQLIFTECFLGARDHSKLKN